MDVAETRLAADGHGGIRVSGALDFSTVAALEGRGAALVESTPVRGVLQVDLGGVTRADSAGIALLIGWLRAARGRGTVLTFVSVPGQMVKIARACGMHDLLGFGEGR